MNCSKEPIRREDSDFHVAFPQAEMYTTQGACSVTHTQKHHHGNTHQTKRVTQRLLLTN